MVVPSLPGYGFSDAPKRQGEGSIGRFAEIMHKVMIELGYKKYSKYVFRKKVQKISKKNSGSDIWYGLGSRHRGTYESKPPGQHTWISMQHAICVSTPHPECRIT